MTKEEIAAVLAELDADLKKGEADAAQTLRKAAGDEPEPKEDASASAGGEDSGAPAADAGGPPAPDASASAGGPPPPAAGPDASMGGAPAPGGDPAMDAGLTPEALQAEYAQLPPQELDMHLQAALAAKEAMSAAAAPGAGAPGAMPPPPGAAPAPDASASAGMPPMGKEELRINKEANGGKISMGKSEEFESLKKDFESLKKSHDELLKTSKEDTENLSKAVKLVLEAPVRKSVSAISEIAPDLKKSEEVKPMSTRDVDDFIKTNAHKMTKSERDLWLAFVDKKVPAAKLAPMLERLSSAK
jgi:hypothetical protein